ncbi:hypothetical protein LJC32_07120, partial [Oscillospiraceae bacterium OttesenSCG-928-F05]|nr:hypothetical protein [Oscillospiraceae bacterium OttesenSCG-928-F05]
IAAISRFIAKSAFARLIMISQAIPIVKRILGFFVFFCSSARDAQKTALVPPGGGHFDGKLHKTSPRNRRIL